MKKFLFFFLSAYCCCAQLLAQEEMHFESGCNFLNGRTEGNYTLFEPAKAADKIIDDILGVFSIQPRPFILKAADVENAQATMKGRDRYLLYSNDFLNKTSLDAQTRWAAVGIFAHEIAHHVLLQDFAETDPKKRRSNELAADMWAARVMARMGANREETLAAVKSIQSNDETQFYPTPKARAEGMASAWSDEFDKLSVENKSLIAVKRRPLAIDPASFNRWNIANAKGITAYYDDEKVTLDIAMPQIYFNKKFNLILCSNDPNMPIRTVRGVGADQPYTSSKQIIWNYLADGVTLNNAARSAQLKILVYASDKLPPIKSSPKTIAGWGLMATTGIAGVIYGLVEYREAQNDYTTNYKNTNLETDYDRANKKSLQSQYTMLGGGALALTGSILVVRYLRRKKAALNAICLHSNWEIEPVLIAGLPSFGLACKRTF